MLFHRIDIFFIQEHNVKDINKLEYIEKHCHIILNSTHLLKGGTAFFINKLSQVTILNHEMDAKGQILSVKCTVLDKEFQLINIYAPSGKNKAKEREELFKDDLLYYLRNNLRNVILAGDWNCITSPEIRQEMVLVFCQNHYQV